MTKNSKIGEVNWENLPFECLVDILGRVGIESLVVDVPFVCKSWYKATLDPFCWKQLHFPGIARVLRPPDPFVDRFRDRFGLNNDIYSNELKFIKRIIDRSAGFATSVDLRHCCDQEEEVLNYVADKCPALKNLVVLEDDSYIMEALTLNIGKLKSLESLEITCEFPHEDIITEVGSHCENFVSFKLVGEQHDNSYINEEYVTAIVTTLPKLKFLALNNLLIRREDVIKIIKGCVNLVCLDVRDCRGFDEGDEELSNLASHIPTFLCSGSYIVDSYPASDSVASSDSGDSDSASDSGDSDSASDNGDSDPYL